MRKETRNRFFMMLICFIAIITVLWLEIAKMLRVNEWAALIIMICFGIVTAICYGQIVAKDSEADVVIKVMPK